ncbi:11061_t:CDS:2 [Funneliformis caledonium]|uniref:11061_t:CDS:1 n=1 Tax=Funneliformis caledonium TaxID=1117310 RepID=A0A9N8Z3K9_9GLOM|nr:11061_t:CDS:2 [Funneliformis caledonium]
MEYQNTPENLRRNLLAKQWEETRRTMAYFKIRAMADAAERKAVINIGDENSNQRQGPIAGHLVRLLNDESNKYLEKYAIQCPSYQRLLRERSLLTGQNWIAFKSKLIQEYRKIVNLEENKKGNHLQIPSDFDNFEQNKQFSENLSSLTSPLTPNLYEGSEKFKQCMINSTDVMHPWNTGQHDLSTSYGISNTLQASSSSLKAYYIYKNSDNSMQLIPSWNEENASRQQEVSQFQTTSLPWNEFSPNNIDLLSRQIIIIDKVWTLATNVTTTSTSYQQTTFAPNIHGNPPPFQYFNPNFPYYIGNNSRDLEKKTSVMNLLRYLRWCPSFLNPPVQEYLRDENYVYKILIPKLYDEAFLYYQNPISTVKGALMRGFENSYTFRCYKCRVWLGFYANYSYINIKKHLAGFHNIDNNIDNFIEVNLESFPSDFENPLDVQSWIKISKQ